ncbi:hypothetical protein HanXRQr2_Chr01g0011151 [Helianthus annuus]|uniref:Uncharacterized protein n=1 Tax=Helianthus annuus TaxID=4232 RepID=A0A9K3P2A5_HELAN|nr:hypothetical protein HanXRQr2_Chr01g0011151 [Helianthus annuus]
MVNLYLSDANPSSYPSVTITQNKKLQNNKNKKTPSLQYQTLLFCK